jgi:hypothetical protein
MTQLHFTLIALAMFLVIERAEDYAVVKQMPDPTNLALMMESGQ